MQILQSIAFQRVKKISLYLGVIILSWQLFLCDEDLFTFSLKSISLFNLRFNSPTSLRWIVNGVVTIVCLSLIVRSLLKGTPKKLNKSVIGTIAILALAIVVFAGIPGYSGFVLKSYAMSQQPGPIFGKEFREAFEWIRAETKPESVVAAWWDYGSAINELGRRATIIDDEQLRYWVHLMARHVMMAQTEDEALEFLKTHKATHLMLSYREIKNLWAISSIGSDL